MDSLAVRVRTPTAEITKLPGSLPIADISPNVDHEEIAASHVSKLSSLSTENFTQDALWRDSFALTGTLRTFFSAPAIETAWTETSTFHRPGNFALKPNTSRIARFGPKTSWVEASFTFTTEAKPATICSGFISLVPDSKGGWKIWLLRTILEQLKGYSNVDVLQPYRERENGTIYEKTNSISDTVTEGADIHMVDGMTNGISQNKDDGIVDDSTHQIYSPRTFDCVVVGGGQAGLSTGGRLKALGVSYVVLDKNERIGDNWMLRYDSAKRNCHLPLMILHQSNDS